jgi:hypothetical protein
MHPGRELSKHAGNLIMSLKNGAHIAEAKEEHGEGSLKEGCCIEEEDGRQQKEVQEV